MIFLYGMQIKLSKKKFLFVLILVEKRVSIKVKNLTKTPSYIKFKKKFLKKFFKYMFFYINLNLGKKIP